MAATSSVIPAAIDLKDDEHDHNSEEWLHRGCASFDKRTGGTQKGRLGGLHAILTNADRLWDNGKACYLTSITSHKHPHNLFIDDVDHHMRLRPSSRYEDPTRKSQSGRQRMGAVRQPQVPIRYRPKRDHSYFLR